MNKLVVYETDKSRYVVRPMDWAGIFNEKGQIKEYLNHLALFIKREDAEKFAEWKMAKEQCKLLRLPCAVGDTIYVIPSKIDYKLNILDRLEANNRVYAQPVDRIDIFKSGYFLSTCDGTDGVGQQFYKETWFLTQEEAETALQKMRETEV